MSTHAQRRWLPRSERPDPPPDVRPTDDPRSGDPRSGDPRPGDPAPAEIAPAEIELTAFAPTDLPPAEGWPGEAWPGEAWSGENGAEDAWYAPAETAPPPPPDLPPTTLRPDALPDARPQVGSPATPPHAGTYAPAAGVADARAIPAPRRSRLRRLAGPLWWTALAAAALAVTWLAPTAALDGAEDAIAWLRERNHDTGRAVLSTLVVAALLLSFVLSWARHTATGRSVRLPGDAGRLPLADLAALLADGLRDRPDVQDARVEVQNRHRRGLAVRAEVLVTPDARLDDIAAFARRHVIDCLERQVGVTAAATPRIQIRYHELDLRRSQP